jgi:hypothetical protein
MKPSIHDYIRVAFLEGVVLPERSTQHRGSDALGTVTWAVTGDI